MPSAASVEMLGASKALNFLLFALIHGLALMSGSTDAVHIPYAPHSLG